MEQTKIRPKMDGYTTWAYCLYQLCAQPLHSEVHLMRLLSKKQYNRKNMSHIAMVAHPSFTTVRSTANKPRQKPKTNTQKLNKQGQRPTESTAITATNSSNLGFGKKKKEPVWQCIQNCGACCKLNKGPSFPSPEEIFYEPSDIEQYKSLIGPDGWCIHYEKVTRKCSIYADRPYFCRVEPDIFETLYGIDKKKFNKEACSCCIDTIKDVYGSKSEELNDFNHAIWSTSSK